jgi:GNAT superfamily N-acetyltransferase
MSTTAVKDIRIVDATYIAAAIAILREAAQWLIDRGMGHWSVDTFHDDESEARASAGELVIGFEDNAAAAVMLLQDLDTFYWPTEPRAAALYIHKLAVRRASAGQQWSHHMIEWAAAQARARAIPHLRLDTVTGPVLRSLYERLGFHRVDAYPIRIDSLSVIRMERRLSP